MLGSAWTLRTCAWTMRNSPVAADPTSRARASICSGHSATRGGRTSSDGSGHRPAAANFPGSKRKPPRLVSGTGLRPVSGASRSTACHCAGAGTLMTRSWRLRRFWAVCPSLPRPRTITCPSAQAEDMGARLTEPSSFSVDRRTTGVPKYRIVGVMVTWPAGQAVGTPTAGLSFMRPTIGRGLFGAGRTVAWTLPPRTGPRGLRRSSCRGRTPAPPTPA
jgi:hypothetical protein